MTDRADWLNWRRTGLGASDIAGVLGISPWASPFSVWASKTDAHDDDKDTDAMEFGRRAEVMVVPWFTERTGLDVASVQTRCTHHDDQWKLCTVDGFVSDTPFTAALGVLEIKTTSASAEEWANGVPVYYQCQATWVMHVTDTSQCWFAVLHLAFGRPRFEVYEFHRDLADEQFVVERCEQFWTDHVVTGTPPPVDAHEATTDAIKAHWSTGEGAIDADATGRRIVQRLHAHKATAALLEQNITEAENELRALIGDHETLTHDGQVIASWKSQDAARLDTKAMRAAWPDIAAEFTKTTTSRVLRLPKPKGE